MRVCGPRESLRAALHLIHRSEEGAGAFRLLDSGFDGRGFSLGVFAYPADMRLASQETRTYFVTAVTAQRQSLFQVTRTADLMQQTLLDYRAQNRYELHAFVIMPDHLHLLLTPAVDVSLEKAIQFVKGGFSFRLKREDEVWMRGSNETQILTPEKFRACVHYIEQNPILAGLVSEAREYGFSSARVDVDDAPLHLRG